MTKIIPKILLYPFRKIIYFFALTIFMTSCDCLQNVSGTVVDNDTKQPIDSAYIQNSNKDYNYAYTDDKGNFEIVSISGGLLGCPPMTVTITKDGYETVRQEIKNAGYKTIYLKRNIP